MIASYLVMDEQGTAREKHSATLPLETPIGSRKNLINEGSVCLAGEAEYVVTARATTSFPAQNSLMSSSLLSIMELQGENFSETQLNALSWTLTDEIIIQPATGKFESIGSGYERAVTEYFFQHPFEPVGLRVFRRPFDEQGYALSHVLIEGEPFLYLFAEADLVLDRIDCTDDRRRKMMNTIASSRKKGETPMLLLETTFDLEFPTLEDLVDLRLLAVLRFSSGHKQK